MYTPEQLNEWADGLYRLRGPVMSLDEQSNQLRAHAAKIEECERLRNLIKSMGNGYDDAAIDAGLKGEPK